MRSMGQMMNSKTISLPYKRDSMKIVTKISKPKSFVYGDGEVEGLRSLPQYRHLGGTQRLFRASTPSLGAMGTKALCHGVKDMLNT